MHVCKMFIFYIQQQQQQQWVLSVGVAETVLGLKRPFDSLSVRPLISAGLHVSVAPLSIFMRGCASISLTTLSLVLPPTRPLSPAFLFSPGTGLICGLRVQRGIEGGRIGENWKEGGNMKGRSWRVQEEGSMQGRGGQERKRQRVKQ